MKQRLMACLLVLCMVVALVPAIATSSAASGAVDTWDGKTFTEPKNGTGNDESDPIRITSAAEFMWFRNHRTDEAAGKYYLLTSHLDLNNVELGKPVQLNFAGVFDGGNKTIYNAKCQVQSLSPRGLFCKMSGTVKNLTLDTVTMESPTNYGDVTGGLIGQLSGGYVTNCRVENASLHAKVTVGGIVGSVDGTSVIDGCHTSTADGQSLRTSVAYNTSYTVGGIVGRFDAGAATYASPITLTIRNCTNEAQIGGTPQNMANAGGIVGYISSKYEEKVDGVNKDIENKLELINCRNNALISVDNTATDKESCAGGLIGKVNIFKTVLVQNCVNTGEVKCVAGVAGGVFGGGISSGSARSFLLTLEDTVNYGAVTGATYAGGFVGGGGTVTPWNITAKNSAQLGSVTASSGCAGGILGSAANSTARYYNLQLTACYLKANVSAPGTENAYAGLIVGEYGSKSTKPTVIVQGCLFVGEVSATSGAAAAIGTTTSASVMELTDTYLSGVAGLPLIAAGTAATEDTATNADFSGTTVLDALNAAAVAATLPQDTWVRGKSNPELKLFCTDPAEDPATPQLTIDGASLTVGGNVTLNLYVKLTTVETAGVSFEKIYVVNEDGKTYEGQLKGESYIFSITSLRAKDFGTDKTYAVQYTTAESTTVTSTETVSYSPLRYAINMYGTLTAEKPELDPLLLSIVAYADAATGTTAATTAFKETHSGADFTTLPSYESIYAKDTNTYTYDTATMPGFGAELTETVALTVSLSGTVYTGVTATIGEEALTVAYNNETKEATITGFYATDLCNTITFTFTGEGVEALSVTYSLMQYLNGYAANAQYGAVARATATYLDAARSFCVANAN